MFLVRISVKKKECGRAGGFFFFFFFVIISYCMLSLHIITFPRDTLELLGQTLIKRNILNTSLFNFDTHKGLTVKIYIILVCTQQQWTLQVTPVGFCS